MKPLSPHAAASTPTIDASGLRIAVVTSEYHAEICHAMAKGASDTFYEAGGARDALIHVTAPGAFELVVISAALAAREEIDAVVALGCVLTGETSHDRFLCDAVAHGLADLSLRTGKPVGFGVLTCLTIQQARARAGGNKGNKGAEAMRAAIAATRTVQAIHALRAGTAPSMACALGANR